MASFAINEKAGGITEYSCIIGNIVSRIRFEKYIICVKKRHGDIAEIIINELLLHGQMSLNQLVDAVIEKLGAQGMVLVSFSAVVLFCCKTNHLLVNLITNYLYVMFFGAPVGLASIVYFIFIIYLLLVLIFALMCMHFS